MPKSFEIFSRKSGQSLGTYEGDTARDAYGAFCRDAGYETTEQADEAGRQSIADFDFKAVDEIDSILVDGKVKHFDRASGEEV